MKKLALASLLAASILGAIQVEAITIKPQYEVSEACEYAYPNYCGNNSLTNGLEPNQTTLFYMYSNEEGHFFIDPLAEFENVIYIGHEDYLVLPELNIDTDSLHHGKRFIGTFADNELWELVGIEEVVFN